MSPISNLCSAGAGFDAGLDLAADFFAAGLSSRGGGEDMSVRCGRGGSECLDVNSAG